MPSKGHRYCILAAVNYAPPRRPTHLAAGIVDGCVWTFFQQQREGHTGDYYKNSNGGNFIYWWKYQLLPNISYQCLINMENSNYYKKKPQYTPNPSKMKNYTILAKLGHEVVFTPR